MVHAVNAADPDAIGHRREYAEYSCYVRCPAASVVASCLIDLDAAVNLLHKPPTGKEPDRA
jgi:hypothetical protein